MVGSRRACWAGSRERTPAHTRTSPGLYNTSTLSTHTQNTHTMPMYLAIPRTGGRKQSAATHRAEYQRSAPSSIMLSVFAAKVGWFPKLLMGSCVETLELLDDSQTGIKDPTIPFGKRSTYFPHISFDSCIPFPLPPLSIAFTRSARDGVLEDVEEMGGSLERLITDNRDVYLISHPTTEQFITASSFPHIDTNHTAPRSNISVPCITTFLKLRSRLTAALAHVNMVSIQVEGGNLFEVRFESGKGAATVMPAEEPVSGDANMEEGEVRQVPKTDAAWLTGFPPTADLRMFNSALPTRKYWGGASNVPQSPGLFLPFESNYSQADSEAITVFLKRFRGLCIDDVALSDAQVSDIMYDWNQEIAKTSVGERMAHMMMCLEIVCQSYNGLYVVTRPGGEYEGCVILGEVGLKQMGMKMVNELSAVQLEKELSDFGFHDMCLKRVLEIMKVENPPEVKTMRELRSIVMVDGMPSGQQKNAIEKLICNLSFDERPVPVNPSSLKATFELFLSAESIPDTLYLGFENFFTEEKTRLILASFGDMAPSFSPGGIRRRATLRNAKGTTGIQPYSPTPPKILQVKSVPLSAAIPHWNVMMQTGIIACDFENKIAGSRAFHGDFKGIVWKALNEFLDKTILEPGPAETQKKERVKRRREDDTDANERLSKISKLFF